MAQRWLGGAFCPRLVCGGRAALPRSRELEYTWRGMLLLLLRFHPKVEAYNDQKLGLRYEKRTNWPAYNTLGQIGDKAAGHERKIVNGYRAAWAAFLAGWAVFAWPWLSGSVTVPDDAKAHFQPQLQFLAHALHTGQSPFWTPYVFTGSPQIADPQSLLLPCVPACLSRASAEFPGSRRLLLCTSGAGRGIGAPFLPAPGLASRGRHGCRLCHGIRRIGHLAHPAPQADRDLCLLHADALAAFQGAGAPHGVLGLSCRACGLRHGDRAGTGGNARLLCARRLCHLLLAQRPAVLDHGAPDAARSPQCRADRNRSGRRSDSFQLPVHHGLRTGPKFPSRKRHAAPCIPPRCLRQLCPISIRSWGVPPIGGPGV